MILIVTTAVLSLLLIVVSIALLHRERWWTREMVAQEQLFQKERLLYRLPNGPTINIRRWRRRERRRLRRKEQIRRR